MKETGGEPQECKTVNAEGLEYDMIGRDKKAFTPNHQCDAYVSTNVQGGVGTGGEDEDTNLYESISVM